jgi:hypothetical protein
MALKSVKCESISIESTGDTNDSNFKVKCLVQQCSSAKLFTKLSENNSEAEYVEVPRLNFFF